MLGPLFIWKWNMMLGILKMTEISQIENTIVCKNEGKYTY